MRVAEFVKGLNDAELAELGEILGKESLPRLKQVMVALNAAYDDQSRSEVFNDPWTAFHFSRFVESVAARVMHAEALLQKQMM